MKYVCVENSSAISVSLYKPNVPAGIQVFEISDVDYECLKAGTHEWDIEHNQIKERLQSTLEQLKVQSRNNELTRYLNSTDWQVLRHIRQLHLGEPTSLTADEYTQLERERARMADQIKS